MNSELNKTEIPETKYRILSKEGVIHNEDIQELVKSGLIDSDIISYGYDSFLFKTDSIIIPHFIYKNCSKINTVIGTDVQISSLKSETIIAIIDKLYQLYADNTKNQILDSNVKFSKVTKTTLIENGKYAIANELLNLIHTPIFGGKFNINITAHSNQNGNLFFSVTVNPTINITEILEDYLEAIRYINRSYRIKLSTDKLSYCPMDTPLGKQITDVIHLINEVTQSLTEMISTDLITLLEETLETTVDEYSVDKFMTSGIMMDNIRLAYFTNTIFPYGENTRIIDNTSKLLYIGKPKSIYDFYPASADNVKPDNIFEQYVTLESERNLLTI